ncbi:MAG: glycosyltransferase, partial [Ornithinimicrobium sp.]
CYAALDVFVHTGTRETFGQTLQEASASGLPVVAPARGGPIDLVDHGRTGMLFDPDQPGALSAAVSSLIPADPTAGVALRRQMGAQGRAAVVARSWPELTRQLVGHYARVMSSTSTSVA